MTEQVATKCSLVSTAILLAVMVALLSVRLANS